jgi:hypothetical protein
MTGVFISLHFPCNPASRIRISISRWYNPENSALFLPVLAKSKVFRIIPENSTFQTQVINLGMKTEAIFESNFPDDTSLTYHTPKAIFPLLKATSHQ